MPNSRRWLWLFLLLVGCRQQPLPATTVATPTALPASPAETATTGASTPLPPTPLATLPPTPGLLPSPTHSPTATPEPFERFRWPNADGSAVSGWRLGTGPQVLALVHGLAGGVEASWGEQTAQQLVAAGLPDLLTVWLLALPPEQAGIDRRRNADTALDQCPDNDWQPDLASGHYPFQDPALLTLYDLVRGLPFVLFLEPGEAAIQSPCAADPVSSALAAWLLAATGRPLVSEQENGYLPDLLATYGTATVTIRGEAPDLASLLAGLAGEMRPMRQAEAAATAAEVHWLTGDDLGSWRLPPGQPALTGVVALAAGQEALYFLQHGIVYRLPQDGGRLIEPILRPGDRVGDVVVLEPLDIQWIEDELLVLDRAGDVYRLGLDGAWTLEWYDRPVRDISSQYYLALTSSGPVRQLLEGSYHFVQAYEPAGPELLWLTPAEFAVDLVAHGSGSYLLTTTGLAGQLRRYQDTALVADFLPTFSPWRPRQLALNDTSLYVLDQAGYRVLGYDPATGQLQAIYRLANGERIQAIAAAPANGTLLLATARGFYIVGQPEQTRLLAGWAEVPQGDMLTLNPLRGLRLPIPGSPIPDRLLRLPGAPRHYRLGIHEGMDLYWSAGTAVQAVADGIIIRIDSEYVGGDEAAYAAWRAESQRLGYSSAAGADFYRGRQVWLDHGGGVISRYAHLSAVADGLAVGNLVSAGQFIGRVGNSGSPGALVSPDEDAHLHVELWVNSQYLGQYQRPIESYEWLSIIFRRGGQ